MSTTALTTTGPNSITSRSTTPFFGRSYSLEVTPQRGPSAGQTIFVTSDMFEPNALRITFEVYQVAFKAFWFAEIVVWNCDGEITSGPSAGKNLYESVIQEGDTVTLRAGYQADGDPKVIWTGPLFYAIKDRPDVTDHRLILHCIVDRAFSTNNFVNTVSPALSTQYQQALQIAQDSQTPFSIDSPHLQKLTDKSTRGRNFFGNPQTELNYLAEQNDLLSWFDNRGWHTDDSLRQPIGKLLATYGPASSLEGPPRNLPDGTTLSLIGQPQQTPLGLDFKVLLDNRVQITPPLPSVAVQMSSIRQAPIPYPLDQLRLLVLKPQCVVVGVRFIGDTRGTPWYSEITGQFPILDAATEIGYMQQF